MNAIREAHYNLGIAYLEAGHYNRAIPEFEAAIKLDENFIAARCAICRAYLEQGELEKAQSAVTTALKLDATHQPALLLHGTITEAYQDKGLVYLEEKCYTEAVAAFQKAIDLDADLENSSRASPLQNTHIHAHLGTAYIGMKAYQKAIDALQNAITHDPDLVDARYNLGYAYVEQGEYDKAIPHLERAIAIAPNLKRAHYNLASAYQKSGNLESATYAVTETLRLDPDYQPAHELADTIKQAHYNSGIACLNDEHYDEAAAAFQQAIVLDPNFTNGHYKLGLTYLKMEEYPRAVDELQKTITLDPTYKAARHALAVAYLGQQELGKAREAATETLKLDADYQPARSLLEAIDPSFTYLETEISETPEPPESRTSVVPQSGIKPKQEMHYELGTVYRNEKKHTEAIAEFRKAIDLDPNYAAAHTCLAELYLEMGQLDEAESAANAVLRIDDNAPAAHRLLDGIRQARPPIGRQSTPTKAASTPAADPPDTKQDLARGLLFLNNGQYNQAAATFKRVIKADPHSIEAHYGLGQAYLELEAFDDAQAAVDEVLKRKPNHQQARELFQIIKLAKSMKKNQKIRKKVLSYAAILSVIVLLGIFIEVRFEIIPWPNSNLKLSVGEIRLDDKGNGWLDASEDASLKFKIQNAGKTARNIEIKLEPSEIKGVSFDNFVKIRKIRKNTAEDINIRMTADDKVKGRDVDLKIKLFGKTGWFEKKELLQEKFALKIMPREDLDPEE